MKMLLFIYLRWGRKFGGIWVIDSSEMKENAAVVRKQLQNSSENTNNHECNQSKLRIVLLSYSRLLLIPAARLVDCKRRSLELEQTEQGHPSWSENFIASHCILFFHLSRLNRFSFVQFSADPNFGQGRAEPD